MDTGGNCGSQSSTLIIRGLALGEIHLKKFLKLCLKNLEFHLLLDLFWLQEWFTYFHSIPKL